VMTTPRWGAGRPARVIRATGRACRSGTPMVSPLLSVGTIQRAAPARKAPAVYPAAARGALSACRERLWTSDVSSGAAVECDAAIAERHEAVARRYR